MLAQLITRTLDGLIERSSDSFGMLVLHVNVEYLLSVVARLHAEFEFDLFLDVTAIDYPDRSPRFDVVYHLYSRAHNERVRLKVSVPEQVPAVPTLTTVYGAARYMEREVHDMYGIDFTGNADLRPILLYEGFNGHPLRKDYAMEAEQPIVSYRH
jgi:NADH-quinone oxidoreductase subunit C